MTEGETDTKTGRHADPDDLRASDALHLIDLRREHCERKLAQLDQKRKQIWRRVVSGNGD
jgi:hypothetical protein